jgi:hypothetical protein
MARRVLRIFGSCPRFRSNDPPEDEAVKQHQSNIAAAHLSSQRPKLQAGGFEIRNDVDTSRK